MKFPINADKLLSRHYRVVSLRTIFWSWIIFFFLSFLLVCVRVWISERPSNYNMFPLLKSGLEEQ